MADFKKEYDKTMSHEGGYVHDPDDAGGETYKGVARRFHPGWEGWSIIDGAKEESDFPKCLDLDMRLQSLIESFYKQHYWDCFQGDKIPSQRVAGELFDTGVNMGNKRAVKFLQRALNYLNRDGKMFPDMVDDGILGPGTLKSLSIILNKDGDDLLFKIMNVLQAQHYLNYMSKSPTQEKYCRGWFNRVTFSKGH